MALQDAADSQHLSQHMRALANANTIRLKRAELKREIAAGTASVIDKLENPPAFLATMPVGDLLRAQEKWGRVRVRRFLAALRMSEVKQIGSMTDRQRADMVARLRGRCLEDPWSGGLL